jgi:hypothetical protein
VCGAAQAIYFTDAGAGLVAVGPETFRDPLAGGRVARELAELLAARPRTVDSAV